MKSLNMFRAMSSTNSWCSDVMKIFVNHARWSSEDNSTLRFIAERAGIRHSWRESVQSSFAGIHFGFVKKVGRFVIFRWNQLFVEQIKRVT